MAISTVIQAASLAFWLPLEIYQMETLGHPTFVIALRLKNIVAFALGKMGAWGLNNHAMTEDPWDYVHITTWNFLPFLLKRVGAAPRGLCTLRSRCGALRWPRWRASCGGSAEFLLTSIRASRIIKPWSQPQRYCRNAERYWRNIRCRGPEYFALGLC